MFKRFLLAGSLAILLLPATFAQTRPVATKPKPATSQKIPLDPNLRMGKLPNGITYYIRKNTEPKNRAELRLVVKAGSILETDKQVGLAHFTEHMSFNGTKNFKKQELVDFLEKSGVNFGADLNAYTSFDETVYELQLPTDSSAVFRKGFQILEDWAHNVSFENEEIDKERGVVVEEWRLGQGAQERMRAKYFPVMLKGSQYAKRLPIGTKENLDTFRYETVKQFYKDWYRPDLQAVIVVGDVDVNEVESLIKEHFGSIPKPVNPKPRTKYGVPSNNGTNVAIVTDPEQQYNMVQIFYKQPSIPEASTDMEYRQSIVRNLFNQMINQRLDEQVQSGDAPFVMASTSYSKLLGDKDAFMLFGITRDAAQVTPTIESMLRENERVRRFGFTKGELERAKASMLASMESAYNEREKTESKDYVGEYIRNFLNNEPIPGISYEYNLYQKYLPAITLAEVNALIAKWMQPSDRTVIVLAPESSKPKLPAEKDVLTLMNSTFKDVFPYEDKTVDEPLVSALPPAGKISKMNVVQELDAAEITLSNGARVILKPTNFKNDEILISAISKGGTSLAPEPDYLSASNASIAVINGGVGKFDAIALQKALAGKNVFVAPSISTYTEGFTGSTTPKDFETALQLIHLYFTDPRKDEKSFRTVMQQLQASLQNKGNDPNSVFMDTVSYVLGNYHPRRKPLTLESLPAINYEKAYDFYKSRFNSASDFLFTIVGNINMATVGPLLEKYIGSLPSNGITENWRDLGITTPKGNITRVVTKGKENKATVRLYYTGSANYSDLEATQLDQLCAILGIQLREVLREDQGGVYGVGVRGSINRIPNETFTVSINFGCSAENVDKLIDLTMQEINKLKTNGASQVNIDKVTAEDVRSLETAVKENGYWQYNLEQKYFWDEDPKTVLQDMSNLKQLNVQRTKELANKYFSSENFAKMILLPEKK